MSETVVQAFNAKQKLLGKNLGMEIKTFSDGTRKLKFFGLNSISNFKLPSVDYTNLGVDSLEATFARSKLQTINLTGLTDRNITDLNDMLSGCKELVKFTWEDFGTMPVTHAYHMFFMCTSLEEVNMSGTIESKVFSMPHMFGKCTSLVELDLSELKVKSGAVLTTDMFNGCTSLKKVNVSCFRKNTIVSEFDRMFMGCENLREVNLGDCPFHYFSSTKEYGEMFEECKKLERIIVKNVTEKTLQVLRNELKCASLEDVEIVEMRSL